MKIAWLTDLHLNFISTRERLAFYQTIVDAKIDAVLLSGDTAEAPSICAILLEMVRTISKPIYFVLGNHDYYRGSVTKVRSDMTTLTQTTDLLRWLPSSGVQKLTSDTLLVGTDGFADARYGNFDKSHVTLNDSYLITELYQKKLLSQTHLQLQMQQLADDDAQQLYRDLQTSLQADFLKKIIVLTHVPPFPETCTHQGHPTDSNFLPYFASKATGDVLLAVARDYPSVEFYTLCGHTHSYTQSQILPNLTVTVGSAEYYTPTIQEIIIIPSKMEH